MIIHNMRYVLKVATKYQNRGLAYEDLAQEGMIGLIAAVEHYDPDYGVRFATYATHWIKQSIRAALVDTGSPIRLPVSVYESVVKLKCAERNMAQTKPDEVNEYAWLEKETGYTQEQIDYLRSISQTISSLDTVIRTDDNDTTVGSLIPDPNCENPENAAIQSLSKQEIECCMQECLTQREIQILMRRFGMESFQPSTLESIGEEFSITREGG